MSEFLTHLFGSYSSVSRSWHIGACAALGLIGCFSAVNPASAANAPAPGRDRTLPYIFSTKPLHLGAGYYYGGEYRFGLIGGKLSPNGGPAHAEGEPLACEINAGSMLYNTSWSLLNVNFRLNSVKASRFYLRSLRDSTVSLHDCTVDDLVIFSFSSPADAKVPELEFENCALGHVQGSNAFAAGVRLKWSKCYVTKSVLTPAWTSNDASAEMQKNGSRITGCRFVNCLISYDFLAITQDCVFERCHLVKDPSGAQASYTTPPPSIRLAWVQGNNAELQAPPRNLVLENIQLTTNGCDFPVTRMGDELQIILTGIPTPLTDTFKASGSNIPPSSLANLPPSSSSPASFAPNTPTGATPVKGKLCHVNGLLVQETGAGSEAGFSCRMNGMATPVFANAPLEVQFNQAVGESMMKALHEVNKWADLHYNPPPRGAQIELAFEDKYSGKDGPSAAVACALLINGLINDQETDPAFAVTGDMNADGEVQPIGGVTAKIRGATNGRCKYLGLPDKNESNVADVLLLDGPGPLAGIQIFGLHKVDQAIQLANTPRQGELETAINTFASVQEVLQRNRQQMYGMLHNPHVLNKLREVLTAAPNHLSAKYLLLYGTDRLPRNLSLAGSLDGIENGADALIAAIKSNQPEEHPMLHKDVIAEQLTKLKSLRPLLDARIRAYAEAVISFGELVREYESNPPVSNVGRREAKAKIMSSARRASAEWDQIRQNTQIIEELKQ